MDPVKVGDVIRFKRGVKEYIVLSISEGGRATMFSLASEYKITRNVSQLIKVRDSEEFEYKTIKMAQERVAQNVYKIRRYDNVKKENLKLTMQLRNALHKNEELQAELNKELNADRPLSRNKLAVEKRKYVEIMAHIQDVIDDPKLSMRGYADTMRIRDYIANVASRGGYRNVK